MNNEELKRLLEKFYGGESTIEEEEVLKSFFSRDDILQGFEAEKAIFGYYSSGIKIPEPSVEFEKRIIQGIDDFEQKQKSGRNRNLAFWTLSTAATLLIMVGSYFFFTEKDSMKDTFSDPKIAYDETIKILREVSAQLNKGARTLEPVGIINEVKQKKIENNLKNLEYIQKAIDLTRISGGKE